MQKYLVSYQTSYIKVVGFGIYFPTKLILQFLDFSVIFSEFCKAAKHTHEITDTQEGGSRYICIGALGLSFLFA
jgi:hypothetical protein